MSTTIPERLAAMEARASAHDEADRAAFDRLTEEVNKLRDRVRTMELRVAVLAGLGGVAGTLGPQLVASLFGGA